MRYAIVSDIHANLPAWNAVVEDIQSQEIEHVINLGDSVGYGPNPAEVLASVREIATISVLGNHDAVCAMRLDPSIFNQRARAVIEWTGGQLDDDARAYLQALPETDYPADKSFLITHAEVIDPMNFGYILNAEHAKANFEACEDSIIFIGHTHYAGVFSQDEHGEVTVCEAGSFRCEESWRYIINPGSVGDPRSADIVASYCIFDSETREVEFRRVAFDTSYYRQLFVVSGLTSKPFFLRYLDEPKKEKVKMLVPNVMEADLSKKLLVSNPLTLKLPPKTKSHTPAILMTLLLIIGAGSATWIFSQRGHKTVEKPVPKEAAISVASETATIAVIAEKLPVTGRYVRISNPKGKYLALAEVLIVSGEENVALHKKATQSTNYNKIMLASKAVDGKNKGSNTNLISHTGAQRPMWWEVDLSQEFTINSVVLWNRNEGAKLMKRLDGFTLEIFDSKRQLVYRTIDNPGAKRKIVIQ